MRTTSASATRRQVAVKSATVPTLYYLAYGSNLHPLRLAERVPSARFMGLATLPGYRLAFHKRGSDGSGKCNILATGATGDRVHGAVFAMATGHRPLLDRFEGPGYRTEALPVTLSEGAVTAFAYVAETSCIDEELRPWAWYRDIVYRGACYHALPASYREAIARVAARADPDAAREAHHRALLARLG